MQKKIKKVIAVMAALVTVVTPSYKATAASCKTPSSTSYYEVNKTNIPCLSSSKLEELTGDEEAKEYEYSIGLSSSESSKSRTVNLSSKKLRMTTSSKNKYPSFCDEEKYGFSCSGGEVVKVYKYTCTCKHSFTLDDKDKLCNLITPSGSALTATAEGFTEKDCEPEVVEPKGYVCQNCGKKGKLIISTYLKAKLSEGSKEMNVYAFTKDSSHGVVVHFNVYDYDNSKATKLKIGVYKDSKKGIAKKLSTIDVGSTLKVKKGSYIGIGGVVGKYPAVTMVSSKTSVISSKNKTFTWVTVKAKKVGNTTLTFKDVNGKLYKVKVTVTK